MSKINKAIKVARLIGRIRRYVMQRRVVRSHGASSRGCEVTRKERNDVERVHTLLDEIDDILAVDTTVGLMEALAALGEGKEVRFKDASAWMHVGPDGAIRFTHNDCILHFTPRLATARFEVRDTESAE